MEVQKNPQQKKQPKSWARQGKFGKKRPYVEPISGNNCVHQVPQVEVDTEVDATSDSEDDKE